MKKYLSALFVFQVFFISNVYSQTKNKTDKTSSEKIGQIFISKSEYSKLNLEKKKNYIKNVRSEYVKFENELNEKMEIANTTPSIWDAISSYAWAVDNKCLIGGIEQPIVAGKCSSRGNKCDSEDAPSDSFKCGDIFGNVCISRTPVGSISLRCLNASSKANVPTAEEYFNIQDNATNTYYRYCEDFNKAACRNYRNRIMALNRNYGAGNNQVSAQGAGAGNTAEAVSDGIVADQSTARLEPAKPPTPPPVPVSPVAVPAQAITSEPPVAPASNANQSTNQARPSESTGQQQNNGNHTQNKNPKCKQLLNFVFEGSSTQESNNTVYREKMLHSEASDYAGALAQFSKTNTAWTHPNCKNCNDNNSVDDTMKANDPNVVSELKSQNAGTCSPEIGTKINNFIIDGNEKSGTWPKTDKYQNKYRKLDVHPYDSILSPSISDGDGLQLFSIDQKGGGQEGKTSSSKIYAIDKFLKKIKSLKEECGKNADLSISLGVFAHGNNDSKKNDPTKCYFGAGFDRNGKQVTMNAEEFYNNVYKPLKNEGLPLHIDFGPCYSGCFVEYIRKMEQNESAKDKNSKPVCMVSSSRADQPSYGQDELFQNTFTKMYSFYLNKLGNPLHAQLCARVMDRWNQPQTVATSDTRSIFSKSLAPQNSDANLFDRPDVKNSFDEIANNTNSSDIKALPQKCKALARNRDFPRSPNAFTPEERTNILNCAKKHLTNNNRNISGLEALYDAATDNNNPPGIQSLKELAQQSNANNLSACNMDWNKYKNSSTGSQQSGVSSEGSTNGHTDETK